MQHRGDADAAAEVPAVRGDPQCGLGAGPHQQVIGCPLVPAGDVSDPCRHGEDEVEVADRQQPGPARREPGPCRAGLALRAVPVAARTTGDVLVRTVFAPRDVAAKRGGAALLDGRHHLQLLEADVPGIGGTPCRPVVAEDVRDLQRGAGQGGGLRRPGLALPALARGQTVRRAGDIRDHPGGDPGIARRGGELRMAEQGLDHPDVDAALQEVGGEAVAQAVQRHRPADPGGGDRRPEQPGELARRQAVPAHAAGEQPAIGRRHALVLMGRALRPPVAQQAENLRRQHHVAVLASLGLDGPDDSLRAADVTDPEPHHLAGAQPAATGQRQRRPQLEAGRHRQEPPDLVPAQHRRDLPRLLQVVDLGSQIVPAQRHPQQELHPGHDPVAMHDAHPALGREQLEPADVVRRRRRRRAPRESREARTTAEMIASALPAESARPHVFDHPLTQRRGRGVAGGGALDVHGKAPVLVEARSPHRQDTVPGPHPAITTRSPHFTAAPATYREAISCDVAQKTVDAFLHEPFLPAPDAGLRLACPVHDLSCRRRPRSTGRWPPATHASGRHCGPGPRLQDGSDPRG